jgi:hypothetical protein
LKILKITLIVACVCSVFASELNAQTIVGDWYTPLRNKLLHITISQDSIAFRKCSFDVEMQDYGYVDMRFKIEKVTNNYFIVSDSVDIISMFYWVNFSVVDGKNNLNIESLNTSYSSIIEVENAIKLNDLYPINITFFDKATIAKIRQQRNITTMTVDDFKSYASKLIELDTSNDARKNQKFKLSYLYVESTGRIVLSDLGFNSSVKGTAMDAMFEKFAEHPETKEIFMRMIGNGK